ncbi:MAG: hypothetical protein MZW92_32490 [Comamonadaceae bacterium]|nr:hypothetical protein [Comamonadaceae bacterium]
MSAATATVKKPNPFVELIVTIVVPARDPDEAQRRAASVTLRRAAAGAGLSARLGRLGGSRASARLAVWMPAHRRGQHAAHRRHRPAEARPAVAGREGGRGARAHRPGGAGLDCTRACRWCASWSTTRSCSTSIASSRRCARSGADGAVRAAAAPRHAAAGGHLLLLVGDELRAGALDRHQPGRHRGLQRGARAA